MKAPFLPLLLALATAPAMAQHAHHGSAAHTPYAGMQQRDIKALSEQQISDLRAGKGMSLALPAELNGYPGPAHVLELADRIKLSEAQQRTTQALFEQMQAEAKTLGDQLIAAERELDRLFQRRQADWPQVEAATARAAQAQGALRASHLKYHLKMMEVLDSTQVAQYQQLRGYR